MKSVAAIAPEPRLRDADRSQQAILDAAREEFALLGLAGARVDSIAERAGLNKRLIYYYFSSKDDLFLAVLESAEAVRRLMEFTWNYYLEHPEFITLLNSANLHQARHLEKSKRVREMNSPVIQTLGDILERGRKEGVFRGGVDPVHLYISIAGLAYFYLSNNYTLSAIFGRDLMTRKARSERLSHMCDVILGYVLRD
jgi:AcrR family transcriptional regulator